MSDLAVPFAAGAMSFLNQGATNAANAQMQWQANMQNERLTHEAWKREDNAVTRRVQDLKNAGLSPTLAAGAAAQSQAPIAMGASRHQASADLSRMGQDVIANRQLRLNESIARAQIADLAASSDLKAAQAEEARSRIPVHAGTVAVDEARRILYGAQAETEGHRPDLVRAQTEGAEASTLATLGQESRASDLHPLHREELTARVAGLYQGLATGQLQQDKLTEEIARIATDTLLAGTQLQFAQEDMQSALRRSLAQTNLGEAQVEELIWNLQLSKGAHMRTDSHANGWINGIAGAIGGLRTWREEQKVKFLSHLRYAWNLVFGSDSQRQ